MPNEALIRERLQKVKHLQANVRGMNLDDAYEALQAVGIEFSRNHVRRILKNQDPGVDLNLYLEMVHMYLTGKSPNKFPFFLEILDTAKEMRTEAAGYARYTSEGYTEGVAEFLGINNQDLRRLILAMRTEVMLSYILSRNEYQYSDDFVLLADYFSLRTVEDIGRVVHQYLLDRQSVPLSLQVDIVRALDEAYGKGGIRAFYRLLYDENTSARTLGTLVPYEIEFLLTYYKWQESRDGVLSPLDMLLLNINIDQRYRNMERIVEILRRITRVSVTPQALGKYRDVLLGGETRLRTTSKES